ncbi:MAG: hypothetical protein KGZ87_05430 [Bacteroidetes bacterium]|nr:hypothetical protein [Bacteroidota bacterium]
MSDNLPKVKIEKVVLIENEYEDQHGNIYSALKLIEQSKKYKQFDLPLIGINLNRPAWNIGNLADFIHHVDRLRHTNIDHPIILDNEGVICDGLHRVCKAILEGKTTIKAIRLEEMPPKDRQENKD